MEIKEKLKEISSFYINKKERKDVKEYFINANKVLNYLEEKLLK